MSRRGSTDQRGGLTRQLPPERFGVERLEQRALLTSLNFPSLEDLGAEQNNTVIKIETNLGEIDIVMFDEGAPITVANFLDYVRDGDWDESFFHRLAFNGVNPFVLQGGGFRYDNADGVRAVPNEAPIQNEFSLQRSNVERTLAMAKLGNNPNSATNQFFFNLGDNSDNLDNQNGGFTVFARVVNDESWEVVEAITALARQNFSQRAEFDGSLAQPNGNFSTTPVTSGFNINDGVQESELVTILDIEIIKPFGTTSFYGSRIYYPEGFAGSTINEFLPMVNPNEVAAQFQVIVRAETTPNDGFFRDRVIATQTIGANARGGITISQFANMTQDLVPQGVPYSIEIHSTLPLAATISHYDFGTSTGESFTTTRATTWSIADAAKRPGGQVADFLVWQNINPTPANISVQFIFQNQDPVTVDVTTDIYRRGGLSLAELGQLPSEAAFSVRITSDQLITAALTHFDTTGDDSGFAILGTSGTASRFGVVPLAVVDDEAFHNLTFINPHASVSALVRLDLDSADPNIPDIAVPIAVTVPAGRRVTYSLDAVPNISFGARYSVRYSTLGDTPLFAHTAHHQFTDLVAHPVAISAAPSFHFAEGFMDPARAGVDVLEFVSVYNPNTTAFGATVVDREANVDIVFRYGDGFILRESVTIPAGGRVDFDIHTLDSVLNQGTENNRFFYSVEVSANVAIIAQMWHYDLTLGGLQPSGGFGTLGTFIGQPIRLDQLAPPSNGGG